MFSRKYIGQLSWVMFLLNLLLQDSCQAQEVGELPTDDIFTKPTPPTISPDAIVAPLPTTSPTPLKLRDNSTVIRFVGNDQCKFYRDTSCLETTQETIDKIVTLNETEIEKEVHKYLVKELGVSYSPFVSANVDYWKLDSTVNRKPGGTGFSVKEQSEKYEVRALALGVVINSIANIDNVQGTFSADLKLFFFNITEGPFPTMESAINKIYKDDSRTTSTKDQKYYRLHEQDLPGAWSGTKAADGEHVVPDGVCRPEVLETMKPVKKEDLRLDLLRLPRLNARIFPAPVEDSDGNLSYIEVVGASFKYKPWNRQFFPTQRYDLLDIFFEMMSTNLIHEDQRIVQHLLCLHPAFSGFSSHVFGADVDAGHSTSDSLTMVPYIFFDKIEPWLQNDYSQFEYGAKRQRQMIGNGSKLDRMLSLRILVEQPPSKGGFTILPVLFVSLAAIANFVSSDPIGIGGTSMIQALLGVNSLVTQNTEYIGINTVMGQSLLLAYGINALWISTVMVMMLINQAKNDHNENRWYITFQMKIFRYLRLLAASIFSLYIPLLCAYSIDYNNGSQTRIMWVWGLVVGAIFTLFIVRFVRDYLKIKRKRKDHETELMKEFSDISKFNRKPLNQWSRDEVLRWVSIGSMNEADYFSEAKRLSIKKKLEAACVDGKILAQFGTDIDKLVQFVGLPFGDAVKLSEELKIRIESNYDSDKMHVSTALVVVKNGGQQVNGIPQY